MEENNQINAELLRFMSDLSTIRHFGMPQRKKKVDISSLQTHSYYGLISDENTENHFSVIDLRGIDYDENKGWGYRKNPHCDPLKIENIDLNDLCPVITYNAFRASLADARSVLDDMRMITSYLDSHPDAGYKIEFYVDNKRIIDNVLHSGNFNLESAKSVVEIARHVPERSS